jgi:membrane protein implicated in regulation of membrane protease activity
MADSDLSMGGHIVTFIIFLLILLIILAGIIIANIAYFADLANGGSLSKGQSTSMLWVSVIAFIILIIVIVWIIVLLVRSWKGKKEVRHPRDIYRETLGVDEQGKRTYEEMYSTKGSSSGLRSRTSNPVTSGEEYESYW